MANSKSYYLIGSPIEEFTDLPTNKDVLCNYVYNKDFSSEVNLNQINVSKSKKDKAINVTVNCILKEYSKRNIKTFSYQHVKNKLKKLIHLYENCVKNKYKSKVPPSIDVFKSKLDNLFDIKSDGKTINRTTKLDFVEDYVDNEIEDNTRKDPDYQPDNNSDDESDYDTPNNILSNSAPFVDHLNDNLKNAFNKNLKNKLQILSSDLCLTLDEMKISNRNAFKLISAVLKELDIDVKRVVLSKSTLSSERSKFRAKFLEQMNSSKDAQT